MPIPYKPIITQSELRRIFDLDAARGVLIWKYRPEHRPQWNARYAGKVAGHVANNNGRIRIAIDGQKWLAHRIAWKWLHDEEPPELDHKDGVPTNNKPSNLRPATREQNTANSPRRKGKTLPKGVIKRRDRSHGKVHYLGTFDTAEEASAAYAAAAIKLHKQFALSDRRQDANV